MVEQNGEMVFRTHGLNVVVRSPEQLASSGIQIHPNAMERVWGPDAIERYRQAIVARNLKAVRMESQRSSNPDVSNL